MIEKLLRKAVDKNDNHIPQNFEQLVQKYGLEKTWIYIDKIIDHINSHEELYEEIDTKVKEVEKETNNTSNIAKEAQSTAEEAKKNSEESKELVEENNSKVADIQESVEIAESASIAAQEASNQANTSAKEAQTAAEEAKILADDSKKIAAAAQEESNKAMANAQSALEETSAAREEVAEAKADISNVREELTQEIESISNEMEADYAKKTDVSTTESNLRTEISQSAAEIQSTAAQTYAKKTELTEVESALRTQITQNSEEIKSTATDITRIDAEVEDAKEKANVAQVSATTAQNAAEEAKENAEAAQTKANEASSAASTAQAAADEAAKNLEIAKENLEEIQSQADATDEQVELAKKAVEEAQAAADKAQSDANAAQTVADIAQATADTAKTSADNAKTAADNAQAAADEAQAGVNELDNRVTKNETAISQKADSVTVTAMQTKIDSITKTKTTKEGTTIEIDDSAEEPILELEVDGASRQDGTPTLETPIEIKSVGDDVNLLPVGEVTLTSPFVERNYDGTFNILSGTSEIDRYHTEQRFVLSAGTYTFSSNKILPSGIRLYLYNVTDNDYSIFLYNKRNIQTFTIEEEKTVQINMSTLKNIEITALNNVGIKLQKGTVATAYSEYGKGTVEIKKSGENKYDNSNIINTVNATISKSDTGFTYTRTATASTDLFVATNELILKPNTTYTAYYNKNEKASLSLFFYSDQLYGTQLERITVNNTSDYTLYRFTTDNTGKVVIGFYSVNQVQGDTGIISNIMILEGEKNVEELEVYKPYFANNYVIPLSAPLRSLPNGVCDTIEEDGIHRRVGSVVLDGSDDEGWGIENFGDVLCRYSISISNAKTFSTTAESTAISSHFINNEDASNSSRAKEGQFMQFRNSRGFYFCIEKEKASTVEEFKTWLSKNNTEVQYELAEEVIEPLTEKQQAVIDSIKTNLYKQYFTSDANMRITYVRNNGLSDMYETKDSASKKYTETEKKIAQLNISTDGIKGTVGEFSIKLENDYMTEEQVKAETKTVKDDIQIIKGKQTSFEATAKGFQVQIDTINNEGVKSVKNTTVNIDEKGVTVGKSDSEFSTTMSNTGTYMYSYDKQIAKYDKDGGEMYNLKVQNEAIIGNLRMLSVEVESEKRTHIHWIGG